jgi:hypothetical protein
MNVVKTSVGEGRPAAPPVIPKPAVTPVAAAASLMAAQAANQPASRDATFERLSRMFRRTGTDVTAQTLFRVLLEHRMESAGIEE